MRQTEPTAGEPREISLFEQWMGMTPEEWDAQGFAENAAAGDQPALLI